MGHCHGWWHHRLSSSCSSFPLVPWDSSSESVLQSKRTKQNKNISVFPFSSSNHVFLNSSLTCWDYVSCVRKLRFLWVLKLHPPPSRHPLLGMAEGGDWVRGRQPRPLFRALRCWNGLNTGYFRAPLPDPDLFKNPTPGAYLGEFEHRRRCPRRTPHPWSP